MNNMVDLRANPAARQQVRESSALDAEYTAKRQQIIEAL